MDPEELDTIKTHGMRGEKTSVVDVKSCENYVTI